VRRIVLAALIVVSSGISAYAQSTQVWPEMGIFTRLNERMRFYFLATRVIGGAAFPLNRRLELEGYVDYQHDTGGDPNRQVYAIGTVLNLYF
jgi:hypothetical protein